MGSTRVRCGPAGGETSSSQPRLGPRRNCCSWRQATATISCRPGVVLSAKRSKAKDPKGFHWPKFWNPCNSRFTQGC